MSHWKQILLCCWCNSQAMCSPGTELACWNCGRHTSDEMWQREQVATFSGCFSWVKTFDIKCWFKNLLSIFAATLWCFNIVAHFLWFMLYQTGLVRYSTCSLGQWCTLVCPSLCLEQDISYSWFPEDDSRSPDLSSRTTSQPSQCVPYVL